MLEAVLVLAPANLQRKEEAVAAAARIEGRSVVVLRQAGEGGQLYGSVNPRDIAAAFVEEGVSFQRQQVRLASPIKELGVHQVRIARESRSRTLSDIHPGSSPHAASALSARRNQASATSSL